MGQQAILYERIHHEHAVGGDDPLRCILNPELCKTAINVRFIGLVITVDHEHCLNNLQKLIFHLSRLTRLILVVLWIAEPNNNHRKLHLKK